MDYLTKFLIVFTFLLIGCIDEFPINGNIPTPDPVIEGLVVDKQGDSFVRISSTLSILGIREDEGSFGSGATVEITDQLGNVHIFSEQSSGLYKPQEVSFKGLLGHSYRLHVTLSNGNSYQSMVERLNAGIVIDSMFVAFKKSFIPNTQQITGSHVFFITASTESLEEPVLFRTQSLGIAQVAAIIGGFAEICYSFRRPINREIVVGNTKNTSENKITLQVATEPYDFHSRYFIEVSTFSLSPQGHTFWNSIARQQQIAGSIFDSQLSEIIGTNITNIETNESIIGYFGASAINSDSLFFNRFETAGFVTTVPPAPASCVDIWRNATLEIPPQFQ